MLTSLALLPFLAAADAEACGGFFCNRLDPVEQNKEHIVFEVDRPNAEVTMHVQIGYQGPAEEFAWIVPVQGEPDLFVSTDALFSVLSQSTRPTFWLNWEVEGECPVDYWYPPMAMDDSANANGVPESGVSVVSEQAVGPYDTVVLNATDADELVVWLQDAGYAIPDAMDEALAPYIGADHNFVALKLRSDRSVGDLTPLGMRYNGTTPAIPIQLTSVAAADDMQLVTYLIGDARGVPTNYLHVELNETAIDWFTGGSNYLDVVSMAADEAGGHAFTTEFVGETTNLRGTLYQSQWAETDFAAGGSATAFLENVMASGIPSSNAILELFRRHAPVPESLGEDIWVYNCPSCYDLDQYLPDFDSQAAAADLQENILVPLEAADGMFQRQDRITRLGSSMSPHEMTLDPMFGFNDDMPQEVSNFHEARLVYDCPDELDPNNPYMDFQDTGKTLILSDGTEIKLPSDTWLQANNMTASEWLAGLEEPAAQRIEETSATGLPSVIVDVTDLIDDNVNAHNALTDNVQAHGACGCTSTGGGLTGGLWLGLAGLLFGRRR